MPRQLVTLLPVIAIVGAWFFLQKYEIDENGIRSARPGQAATVKGTVPVRPGNMIRIASFNIQVFGEQQTGRR